MLLGMRGGVRGIPGKLFGAVRGRGAIAGGLTASLKGSVSAGAVLAGGLTLKRALVGAVVGGATLGANLSGGAGTLRGSIPSNAVLMARLTNSLKGAVGASPSLSGALSLQRALAGNVPGGATFASALTGAGGVMPTGASGIWYAKDYDATNKAVPNTITVGSTPVYPAISRYNGPAIAATNPEVNFGAATPSLVSTTGPTGATENVHRMLATGDWYVQPTGGRIPTGKTWTVGFDYKSNTGANQTFKFGNFDALPGGVLTATTSWQSATQTFTAGTWPMLISPDRATGIDMLITNIRTTSGSVDPGREVFAGHAYFDPRNTNSVTNPSTGVLDLSNSGSAMIRFPSDITATSGFTCGAMVKRVSSGGSGYQSILTKLEGYGSFATYIENSANTPNGALGSAQATPGSGVWDTNGAGWHLITHRYDGSYYDIFLDNARIIHAAISPSATVIRNLLLGSLNDLGLFSTSHQFNSWFLYPTALTISQVQTSVFPALKARLLADGQTWSATKIVCAEGDSITADGSSYYRVSASNLNGQGVDYAVSGSTIATMVTRLTSAGVLTVPVTGSSHVISVLIGANDLGSYTGATTAAGAANWLAALFSYTDQLRAAGWKVLLCTVLPKNDSEHNARRAIVNPQIRSSVGTHCDGVCDFDTDAQMGVDNSFTAYPANWTDGTHPNATGHARLAPIYYAAANAIT